MKKEITEMTLNLGRIVELESFTFRGIFSVPTDEGNTAACRTEVKGTIVRRGSRLLLDAQVESKIHLECSRCLGKFDLVLSTGFDLVFHREERARLPEGMDEEDFVHLTDTLESRYDVFPRVRESILLELPILFLCREDCKGLCSACGANLNEGLCGCPEKEPDPRWQDLKKLLRNDDTK
jgi:uncharacterized protein